MFHEEERPVYCNLPSARYKSPCENLFAHHFYDKASAGLERLTKIRRYFRIIDLVFEVAERGNQVDCGNISGFNLLHVRPQTPIEAVAAQTFFERGLLDPLSDGLGAGFELVLTARFAAGTPAPAAEGLMVSGFSSFSFFPTPSAKPS